MVKVPVILIAGVWGLASAWWLITGLRSGIMRGSFGTSRVGEAARDQRPFWFWTYAAVNTVIVAICALLVAAMVFAGR